MPKSVAWAPGAVTAGAGIDLPATSPSIDAVLNCTLFRGSDGTAAAAGVAAVPTKVDVNTITLDVDTLARDLLELRYLTIGELGPKA